ncbi:MAG TPA: hypothetical protein VK277_13705 [Acidimicrobiales bacterium]|nr:hypothetical protein [Acidimicrobiales bacterium]
MARRAALPFVLVGLAVVAGVLRAVVASLQTGRSPAYQVEQAAEQTLGAASFVLDTQTSGGSLANKNHFVYQAPDRLTGRLYVDRHLLTVFAIVGQSSCEAVVGVRPACRIGPGALSFAVMSRVYTAALAALGRTGSWFQTGDVFSTTAAPEPATGWVAYGPLSSAPSGRTSYPSFVTVDAPAYVVVKNGYISSITYELRARSVTFRQWHAPNVVQ